MFADTISITYNGVAKTLVRTTDGSYKAKYALDGGTDHFTLRVEHTVPGGPTQYGESHMVRLDIVRYDSGEYLRTDSAWIVLKTSDAKQNSSDIDYTAQSLVDFLTDANLDKLVAREA